MAYKFIHEPTNLHTLNNDINLTWYKCGERDSERKKKLCYKIIRKSRSEIYGRRWEDVSRENDNE